MLLYILLSLLRTLFIHNYFVYLQNIKWFFKIYLSYYVQYDKILEKSPLPASSG